MSSTCIALAHNTTDPSLPPIPDDITITQLLLDVDHATSIRPKRLAGTPWLVEDETGREVSLEEIKRRVFGLANAMKQRWKFDENDVVCIFSPNHIDYPITIFATHTLSATPSPANPYYTPAELAHQLTLSHSTIVVAHSSVLGVALVGMKLAGIGMGKGRGRVVLIDTPKPKSTPNLAVNTAEFPTVEELVYEGLSHPPCFKEVKLKRGEAKTKVSYLCFSSGTTGKPKAVAIPHYSSLANVIQFASFYRVNDEHYASREKRLIKPGDKVLAVLPLYHPYGLFLTLHMMLFSGLSVVINANSRFDSTQMLKSIERHRITHLPIVPPQIVLMCKHAAVKDFDLSSIRMVMSSAAPLSAELTSQLLRVLPGASIGQVYGMTETGFCTMQPISQHIGTLGSAGQFFPGVKAKVVKSDGSPARFGESGELYIGGPQLTLRYEGNEQATKETWVDGWIRTGDEVVINENGDLFVKDRIKEVMKVKGFQVAPAELEGHLLDHDDVADACVVGVPDDYSGELPFAFVVLKAEPARRVSTSAIETARVKAAIMKHVSDSKAPYKWLSGGVAFVDTIPRNTSGKLLRRLLRDEAKKLGLKMADKGSTVTVGSRL